MKVVAQRTYTDATFTNVGTYYKPVLVPAARITPERASASRARYSAASRVASRLRKQRGAA